LLVLVPKFVVGNAAYLRTVKVVTGDATVTLIVLLVAVVAGPTP
jgi:hypothetical protein